MAVAALYIARLIQVSCNTPGISFAEKCGIQSLLLIGTGQFLRSVHTIPPLCYVHE